MKRKDQSVTVRLVDGARVRNRRDVEFTMGGHHWRYRWIPRNEIWIERTLKGCDRRATILHERTERSLMRNGVGYDQAHRAASKLEVSFRRHC